MSAAHTSTQIDQFREIEQIKQLKYRYLRHLDCKQFDKLLELFAEGTTTSYDSGQHTFEGKAAILAFFGQVLGSSQMLSQHLAHHPEVTLTSDTTATGIWYMEDTVHVLEHRMSIRGNGIYWDEYIKEDGEWKFRHTGYERIWVLHEQLPENMGHSFTSMFDEQEKLRRAKRTRRDGEPAIVY